MLNNIFSTSTSRDLSVRRVTGDFYQLKISKNTMVKSMMMIPKKKRMKTKTRYLYIKAGSESQEIESRPNTSGIDTARYPKMCCFICTHAILIIQSINIPLLLCKRYCNLGKDQRQCCFYLK